jgi:plastocyanin
MLAMALAFSCSTTIEGEGNSANSNGGSPGSSSSNINPSVIPKIKIVNGTGYSGIYIWIKPSISNNWGSGVASNLSDRDSREITLSQPLSTEREYDILLSTTYSSDYVFNPNQNTFIKYKVTVSNGMTLTFTNSDLNHGSDLPSITIQNRTGTDFNAIYIKPSSAPDTAWGKSYGSLSNNSNKSEIFIPIPPSNYTEFDIQVRSSNPTNTYTKRVTISNGDTIRYTYADSDNPLIGQPVIVFENNTGYNMPYVYIKQTNSTNWGSGTSISVPAGDSRAFTRSQGFSIGNEYDILLSTAYSIDYVFNANQYYTFIKYKVTVSESMTLAFDSRDLNNGSDLPSITIQNRTGNSLNSIRIRPSSIPSTDTAWGKDYGSLSNNSGNSYSIPIPLSNYTVFDIQVKSFSNPTATYTKRNVTISNGDTITYTNADSDSPLIGSPVIVIQNSTGYDMSYIYIKQTNSTDWGNYGTSLSVPAGQSRTFTRPQDFSIGNTYDILLSTSYSSDYVFNVNYNTFIKYNVTISNNGMIVTLTGSDLYTP